MCLRTSNQSAHAMHRYIQATIQRQCISYNTHNGYAPVYLDLRGRSRSVESTSSTARQPQGRVGLKAGLF